MFIKKVWTRFLSKLTKKDLCECWTTAMAVGAGSYALAAEYAEPKSFLFWTIFISVGLFTSYTSRIAYGDSE